MNHRSIDDTTQGETMSAETESAFAKSGVNQLTTGSFPTEKAAEEAFDAAIAPSGLFRVYPERWGHYVKLPPRARGADSEDRKCAPRPRVDRLLLPNKKAIDLGWTYGPVGVEIKRSGTKLGRPVSQAIDYVRDAVFETEQNFLVPLNWIFLWHLQSVGGDIESVMTQNKIGRAFSTSTYSFALAVGGTVVLRVFASIDCIKMNCKPPLSWRLGSR